MQAEKGMNECVYAIENVILQCIELRLLWLPEAELDSIKIRAAELKWGINMKRIS